MIKWTFLLVRFRKGDNAMPWTSTVRGYDPFFQFLQCRCCRGINRLSRLQRRYCDQITMILGPGWPFPSCGVLNVLQCGCLNPNWLIGFGVGEEFGCDGAFVVVFVVVASRYYFSSSWRFLSSLLRTESTNKSKINRITEELGPW